MSKITTTQYYEAFRELAEKLKPKSFYELREYIKKVSNNNEEVMKNFAAWENKLRLDKTELKQIFGKK